MSLRTPLGRVRGLGSAKSGTEHWFMQRLTAVASLPLVVFLVGFCVVMAGAGHAEVTAAIRHPLVALGLGFAIVAITWHMRLGLQVVIEDYVHHDGAKVACLIANSLFTSAVALTGLYAILKISFGA